MEIANLTVRELQASLPKVIREGEDFGIRRIVRNGRAVAFLLSRNMMESILETMELQKNAEFMALVKADRAGLVKYRKVPR